MSIQVVGIEEVCSEIFAGGDAPKGHMSSSRTEEYSIPIYSNGEDNDGLYGYTDKPRVIKPSITISARGTIGYTVIRKEPYVPVVRLISITPISEKVTLEYLSYALQNYHFVGSGTSIPQLTIPMLKEYKFPLPDLPTQRRIAATLDKVSEGIDLCRKMLGDLDELVKTRFVEMFGDPVANDKGWPMTTLKEIAEIRIGPFGTMLHREDYVEGGHALVNPSHIVNGQIVVDPNLTITDEKYEELASYWLYPGDIVLGRRGEMGRCAVVHEEGLLCGTGSMIIRPSEKIQPYFLQSIISSPGYRKLIEDKAVGVTMMNLNVPIVSELSFPLLPVDAQETFIVFMHQCDKSKLAIQQQLSALETLKNSLMQEYFG